jgi:hypothetical protein
MPSGDEGLWMTRYIQYTLSRYSSCDLEMGREHLRDLCFFAARCSFVLHFLSIAFLAWLLVCRRPSFCTIAVLGASPLPPLRRQHLWGVPLPPPASALPAPALKSSPLALHPSPHRMSHSSSHSAHTLRTHTTTAIYFLQQPSSTPLPTLCSSRCSKSITVS